MYLVILGGEHSITYGSYMAYPKETGYIVFDAHMTFAMDTLDLNSVMPRTCVE